MTEENTNAGTEVAAETKEKKERKGIVEVGVKAPKLNKEMTFLYDFGNDMKDAVAKFGEEQVFNGFVRSAVIAFQGSARSLMEAGKSRGEIEVAMKDWKPGIARQRTFDAIGAATAKFATMTAEEQADFIAKLQAKMAEQKSE